MKYQIRSAFTLIEMATSLAIISVLMLGLSGAIMIGSFAIPTTTDTGLADQQVIDVLNTMRDDLQGATTIQYRDTGASRQFRLDMKTTGATGEPSRVDYVYTVSSHTLTRKIDTGTANTILSSIDTFNMEVTNDGSDVVVGHITLSIDGTIQRLYEAFVTMPDKPEAL